MSIRSLAAPLTLSVALGCQASAQPPLRAMDKFHGIMQEVLDTEALTFQCQDFAKLTAASELPQYPFVCGGQWGGEDNASLTVSQRYSAPNAQELDIAFTDPKNDLKAARWTSGPQGVHSSIQTTGDEKAKESDLGYGTFVDVIADESRLNFPEQLSPAQESFRDDQAAIGSAVRDGKVVSRFGSRNFDVSIPVDNEIYQVHGYGQPGYSEIRVYFTPNPDDKDLVFYFEDSFDTTRSYPAAVPLAPEIQTLAQQLSEASTVNGK